MVLSLVCSCDNNFGYHWFGKSTIKWMSLSNWFAISSTCLCSLTVIVHGCDVDSFETSDSVVKL